MSTHLLKEQFGSIRDGELRHLLRRFAVRAPAVVTHQPTIFACIDLELVGRDHEPLKQQLSRAVADETVAFHLAETQATLP